MAGVGGDQVALFARYFNRSPELLGPDEIRAYQLHLIHERKLGWGSLNQAVCALRFLYRKTLGKDWNIESIPFAKQPKKLPLVLSQDEVRAVLEAITNPQNRVIAMILYAAGLRVSEAVSLRIADIDSKRMLLAQAIAAVRHAVAGKPVSPHTLRHCFATHLLEIRHRSAHRPGAARTRLDQEHRDLHSRHPQAHHRGRQSTGIVATATLSSPCTSHRSR